MPSLEKSSYYHHYLPLYTYCFCQHSHPLLGYPATSRSHNGLPWSPIPQGSHNWSTLKPRAQSSRHHTLWERSDSGSNSWSTRGSLQFEGTTGCPYRDSQLSPKINGGELSSACYQQWAHWGKPSDSTGMKWAHQVRTWLWVLQHPIL